MTPPSTPPRRGAKTLPLPVRIADLGWRTGKALRALGIVGLTGSEVAALTEEVARIRHLRAVRAARKPGLDPLVVAARTRAWRRPSARSAAAREAAERQEARRREVEALLAGQARRAAARASVIAAARLARQLGWQVRASHDPDGRVSSYYARPPGGGPQVRISDHEIPWSSARHSRSAVYGHAGYDGYSGPEILFDRRRGATWIRRALALAGAGRAVPGSAAV